MEVSKVALYTYSYSTPPSMPIFTRSHTSFLLLLALLSLVAVINVNAIPSPSQGQHQLLSNGERCQTSAQCSSQYCRRGTCDVKKSNGHKCYKDSGCVSAYCRRGTCDVKKPSGHVCYKVRVRCCGVPIKEAQAKLTMDNACGALHLVRTELRVLVGTMLSLSMSRSGVCS